MDVDVNSYSGLTPKSGESEMLHMIHETNTDQVVSFVINSGTTMFPRAIQGSLCYSHGKSTLLMTSLLEVYTNWHR